MDFDLKKLRKSGLEIFKTKKNELIEMYLLLNYDYQSVKREKEVLESRLENAKIEYLKLRNAYRRLQAESA